MSGWPLSLRVDIAKARQWVENMESTQDDAVKGNTGSGRRTAWKQVAKARYRVKVSHVGAVLEVIAVWWKLR